MDAYKEMEQYEKWRKEQDKLERQKEQEEGDARLQASWIVSLTFGQYFGKGFTSFLLYCAILVVTTSLRVHEDYSSFGYATFGLVAYWVAITAGFFRGKVARERVERKARQVSADVQLCPHCYGEVNAKAKVCPHCRRKMYGLPYGRYAMIGGAFILLLLSYSYNDQEAIKQQTVAQQTSGLCDEGITKRQALAAARLILNEDKNGKLREHGSGVALAAPNDSLILTNYHVIEGAKKIQVWLQEKAGYVDAAVFAQYPDQDLALVDTGIKSTTGMSLISSSGVNQGDDVWAVGWPLDPSGEPKITKGVISANIYTDHMFQTDTAINPGNSGGALINKCGVIGINTAKIEEVGVEGTGYALTSDYVRSVLKEK